MLNQIKQDAQTRMTKSIDALRHSLTTVRTGRASPALLDNIKVKAYGTDTPSTRSPASASPKAARWSSACSTRA